MAKSPLSILNSKLGFSDLPYNDRDRVMAGDYMGLGIPPKVGTSKRDYMNPSYSPKKGNPPKKVG
jgi:hypothetical protein